MKILSYTWILIIILFFSCTSTKKECDLQPEDARMMHFIIERSHPDTVDKYLDHFIGKYKLTTEPSGVADGIYSYTSPVDDYGYTHQITLEIKAGKYTQVTYDEFSMKDGHSKTEDAEYGAKMDEHVEGSAPSRVYPIYVEELLEKQDLREMDAISGATYSLYRLRFAGVMALQGRAKDEK